MRGAVKHKHQLQTWVGMNRKERRQAAKGIVAGSAVAGKQAGGVKAVAHGDFNEAFLHTGSCSSFALLQCVLQCELQCVLQCVVACCSACCRDWRPFCTLVGACHVFSCTRVVTYVCYTCVMVCDAAP